MSESEPCSDGEKVYHTLENVNPLTLLSNEEAINCGLVEPVVVNRKRVFRTLNVPSTERNYGRKRKPLTQTRENVGILKKNNEAVRCVAEAQLKDIVSNPKPSTSEDKSNSLVDGIPSTSSQAENNSYTIAIPWEEVSQANITVVNPTPSTSAAEDNIYSLAIPTSTFTKNKPSTSSEEEQVPRTEDPVLAFMKKQKKHTLEIDPRKRKRIELNIIKKLRKNIDEYTVRIGQQAVVLLIRPDEKSVVFGSNPLDDIIKNLHNYISDELKAKRQTKRPVRVEKDNDTINLPPLTVDGIFRPLNSFNQAELRSFIPLLLKYSTGRGKPGWGFDRNKPVWWPHCLPFENPRIDLRTEKQRDYCNFTCALKMVVYNCYKHHGRLELLNEEYYNNRICDDLSYIESPQKLLTNIPLDAMTPKVEAESEPEFIEVQESQCTNFAICTRPDGSISTIPLHTESSYVTVPSGDLTNGHHKNLVELFPTDNETPNQETASNEKQQETQYVLLQAQNTTSEPEQRFNHVYLEKNNLYCVRNGAVGIVYDDKSEMYRLLEYDKMSVQYYEQMNRENSAESSLLDIVEIIDPMDEIEPKADDNSKENTDVKTEIINNLEQINQTKASGFTTSAVG